MAEVVSSIKITCMDGREFIQEAAFRKHVNSVHSSNALVLARFEVSKTGAVEVTVGVPYNAPVEIGADDEDEVVYGDDVCENCAANGSAARIPMHPSCSCAPVVGWDSYIGSLEQPTDISDDWWAAFLGYLAKAKKGQV
jgi:hypothetical protein